MLILNTLNALSSMITKDKNPQLYVVAKAIDEVFKKNEENLKDPEAWEKQKQIILMIMTKTPQALPYIPLVFGIFEVIIAIVKAEQEA